MYIQHYTTIYSGILSDILFWNSICSCPGPAHSVWSSRYELPRRAGTEVDEKRRRGEGGEGEDELHLCDLETLTWKVGKNPRFGAVKFSKTSPTGLTMLVSVSQLGSLDPTADKKLKFSFGGFTMLALIHNPWAAGTNLFQKQRRRKGGPNSHALACAIWLAYEIKEFSWVCSNLRTKRGIKKWSAKPMIYGC